MIWNVKEIRNEFMYKYTVRKKYQSVRPENNQYVLTGVSILIGDFGELPNK